MRSKIVILYQYFILSFLLIFILQVKFLSVSIQVVCLICFLYFLLNLRSLKDYVLLGIFSGLLILVRGEFWLLFLLILIFNLFFQIKLAQNFILTFLVALIVISPILIKNYKIFDQIIITKSFGYNLWRGNSEDLNINGSFHDIKKFKEDFIKSGQNISKFDLYLDNYYLDMAKDNLSKYPFKYLKNNLNKFFAFSIFNYNSNYPNYYNPLVFIPEIIISVFAVFGIMINIFKNRNYEILIPIFYYLALIPVFFVLPRYKLFILPLYFIFASQFYYLLKQYFFKKTVD